MFKKKRKYSKINIICNCILYFVIKNNENDIAIVLRYDSYFHIVYVCLIIGYCRNSIWCLLVEELHKSFIFKNIIKSKEKSYNLL